MRECRVFYIRIHISINDVSKIENIQVNRESGSVDVYFDGRGGGTFFVGPELFQLAFTAPANDFVLEMHHHSHDASILMLPGHVHSAVPTYEKSRREAVVLARDDTPSPPSARPGAHERELLEELVKMGFHQRIAMEASRLAAGADLSAAVEQAVNLANAGFLINARQNSTASTPSAISFLQSSKDRWEEGLHSLGSPSKSSHVSSVVWQERPVRHVDEADPASSSTPAPALTSALFVAEGAGGRRHSTSTTGADASFTHNLHSELPGVDSVETFQRGSGNVMSNHPSPVHSKHTQSRLSVQLNQTKKPENDSTVKKALDAILQTDTFRVKTSPTAKLVSRAPIQAPQTEIRSSEVLAEEGEGSMEQRLEVLRKRRLSLLRASLPQSPFASIHESNDLQMTQDHVQIEANCLLHAPATAMGQKVLLNKKAPLLLARPRASPRSPSASRMLSLDSSAHTGVVAEDEVGNPGQLQRRSAASSESVRQVALPVDAARRAMAPGKFNEANGNGANAPASHTARSGQLAQVPHNDDMHSAHTKRTRAGREGDDVAGASPAQPVPGAPGLGMRVKEKSDSTVYINSMQVGGAAAAAAPFLKVGDRVISIDGQPVKSEDDVKRLAAGPHAAPIT